MRARPLAVFLSAVAALALATPATAATIPVPPPGLICVVPRTVSIADHREYEGTRAPGSTLTPFRFTVTSSGCAAPGSISFTTLPSRARDLDYRSMGGTVTFPAGDMSARTITIGIAPDTINEVTEDFSVHLCPTSGFVKLGRGAATGFIMNDDSGPLQVSNPLGGNFHCSE